MGVVSCPCGRVLKYEPQHAGRKVKCSGCGKVLVAPKAEDELPPLRPLEEEETPPAEEKRARRRPPRRTTREAEAPAGLDDDGETRLNRVANYFGRNILFPILFCGLGLFLLWGIYDYPLASRASSTPQRIDVKRLIDGGPGDNLHVVVTGATPGTAFAWTRTTSNPAGGKHHTEYLGFFVPLLAPGQGGGDFRVLLKSNQDDKDKFEAVMRRGEFQGTIVNSIDSLSTQEQETLRKAYPKVDFSKVWIIEEGRVPRNRFLLALMFAVGIIGPAAGVAVFVIIAKYRTKWEEQP